MPDLDPVHLQTNVGIGHFQPGDITDPAPCPIPQCKQSGSSPIPCLLDEYSMLVGGAPGSRSSPAEPQREEAQRQHEDCGKASRERTVYGEVWYDHNNR
jgi:hypothetical protein